MFLYARPNLKKTPRPFDLPSDLGEMRNQVINASGRFGLVAKHRMIEYLGYFLHADQKWTEEHLIRPLRGDSAETLVLWRAVGRGTRYQDVLRFIGSDMLNRTTDHRLDRTTRSSLASSLVVGFLHALRKGREPEVAQDHIQQMIRSLDDEVRTSCAAAITDFVERDQEPNSAFQSAAKPFLQRVWPQELSLVSPGISERLATLPAISRGGFAEAVDTIDRFLVPFDCGLMRYYGFRNDEYRFGDDDGKPELSMIDDEAKAKALLRLLDRTVGTVENATIPYDLGDALAQVRKVAPNLTKSREYSRLETAARRA